MGKFRLVAAAAIVWSLSCASQSKTAVVEDFNSAPLSFEANSSQAPSNVKFVARGAGYSVVLAADEVILNNGAGRSPVRMKLAYGTAPTVEALDALPGRSSYFIGNDPSKSRTGVAQYARVRYRNVYPGVDVIFYGTRQRLEYDLIVAPGVDVSKIAWEFSGGGKLQLDPRGDLVLKTSGGELRQARPRVYQEAHGGRQFVDCDYVVKGRHSVGFRVAKYDSSKPLIVDPTLAFTTYLAGSNVDFIQGLAIDTSGNLYVVGQTNSTSFPVTTGVVQTKIGGGIDFFVAKLSSSGTVIYCTYVGGSGNEFPTGIAVDASGNAYITGSTSSKDYPVTAGVVQGTFQSAPPPSSTGSNAVLTKLNAAGTALVYSTYIGAYGSGSNAITVDSTGAAYVTGHASSGLALVNAFQSTPGGAFIEKVNPAGTAYLLSTFLGGSGIDYGNAITLDSSGNIYVAGYTNSKNFPTVKPVQASLASTSGYNVFVAELNAAGSALLFSTYFGGSVNDLATGIALDKDGSIVITGQTASPNFPTTSGAFQTTFGGSATNTNSFVTNAFVAKFAPATSSAGAESVHEPDGATATGFNLNLSTFLGGSGADVGSAVSIDTNQTYYVTGNTTSMNFPVMNAVQPTLLGGYKNAFLVAFDKLGKFLFGTYLGTQGPTYGFGVVTDQQQNVYVAGEGACTGTPNCPVTNFAAGVVEKITPVVQPPCTYSISPGGRTYGVIEISDSFSVSSPPGCTWTVGTSSSFITIDADQSFGMLVSFSLSMNSTGSPRVGTITVTGQNGQSIDFLVTQTTCTYDWSPFSLNFGALPGSMSISVVTQPGCSWTADTDATWLTISPSSGTGSGSIVVVAMAYPSAGTSRHAILFLTGTSTTTTGRAIVFQYPPPEPAQGGTVSSAGSSAATGGVIGSTYGTNLAPTTAGATLNAQNMLPTTIASDPGNTTVSVTGTPTHSVDRLGIGAGAGATTTINAPLFFVSPTQINFQMPWEFVGAQQVSLAVTSFGVTSAPVTVNLANPSPAIFSINQQGTGQGVVQLANSTTFAAPSGSIPGVQSSPVTRGNFVTIYCTGLGAVTNQPVDGALSSGTNLSLVVATVTATVGGVNAPVSFAGLAPGFVALYQVNVQVPTGANTGSAIPLVINVGGTASNTVTIAVQ